MHRTGGAMREVCERAGSCDNLTLMDGNMAQV